MKKKGALFSLSPRFEFRMYYYPLLPIGGSISKQLLDDLVLTAKYMAGKTVDDDGGYIGIKESTLGLTYSFNPYIQLSASAIRLETDSRFVLFGIAAEGVELLPYTVVGLNFIF